MESFIGINKININIIILFIQNITAKSNKTLKIIHDSRDQGSTQDINPIRVNLLPYHLFIC